MPGIDDDRGLEPERRQLRGHAGRVGKARLVPREQLVRVHVVDVERDAVGRDFFLAQRVRDAHHFRLGIVAVAVLLVAEAPQRRQRHAPGQRGVGTDDVGQPRMVDEVVVHLAALRRERREAVVAGAEIEIAAVAVIEEDPVIQAVVDADVERHGRIQRIGVGGVAEGVGIPVGVGAAAPIEVAGLFAQADKAFALLQRLVGRHFIADPRRGQARFVLVDDFSVGRGEGDGEWPLGDARGQRVGRQHQRRIVLGDAGARGGRLGDDSIRKIASQLLLVDAHPDDRRAVDGQLDVRVFGLQAHLLAGDFDRLHIAHRAHRLGMRELAGKRERQQGKGGECCSHRHAQERICRKIT